MSSNVLFSNQIIWRLLQLKYEITHIQQKVNQDKSSERFKFQNTGYSKIVTDILKPYFCFNS